MFEIREGNDRVAMRTRALVEEFTDEMMQAVTNIVFDSARKVSEPENKIMAVVKKCVDIDGKKVRFSAAQHSVNNSVLTINNLKKPPNQGANHLYKFCWSEKTENGRDFYPTRERRYVAKGHYTHKPTAMGNLSSLSQAMTKMQHAYDLQSQKDQAVAVCSGEKNSARTELVRQMKRSFMREFSDFKSQQSKKAETEQAVIEQQLKLKQINQLKTT